MLAPCAAHPLDQSGIVQQMTDSERETFFGPDEKLLLKSFRRLSDGKIPAVFEPSPRPFAAMISHCQLFVTCDSGPMHMACALGTRTVALFHKPNFDRWAPPPDLVQIAYEPNGCSVSKAITLCQLQLSAMPAIENALYPLRADLSA